MFEYKEFSNLKKKQKEKPKKRVEPKKREEPVNEVKDDKKQEREDLIESLMDPDLLERSGLKEKDYSLYCYIFQENMKNIMQKQYEEDGTPVPWDIAREQRLREYIINGGDYLEWSRNGENNA